MIETLCLLLPIAALTGWYLGQRKSAKKRFRQKAPLSAQYFYGLNYLLNEQPDKAVDVFLEMTELDHEMVETHLTLGSLFRRKGEVDRAIRIHQGLLARPSLSQKQRACTLLELGRDYVSAGVLDRAEKIMLELVTMGEELSASLKYLMDIYEQAKDWTKAIAMAQKRQQVTSQDHGVQIAHYRCELADIAVKQGDMKEANAELKVALALDKDSVRASLLQGQIAMVTGQYKSAIKAYKRVIQQDIAFLSELITPLSEAYQALGDAEGFSGFIQQDCIGEETSISAILAFSEWLFHHQGRDAAADFLQVQLQQKPSLRGIIQYLKLYLLDVSMDEHHYPKGIKTLLEKVLVTKPIFRCGQCGFAVNILTWQCPGCKHWSTIKPIHGVEQEV